MELFENIGEELDNEELDSNGRGILRLLRLQLLDETSSSRGTKRIGEERNRRKKLHEQERQIQEEIAELESGRGKSSLFKSGAGELGLRTPE
ncbi:hypothetical protein LINPERPRIM_LOCUS22553 [Linum perenne]